MEIMFSGAHLLLIAGVLVAGYFVARALWRRLLR